MADETYGRGNQSGRNNKIPFPGNTHRTGFDDQSMGDDMRAVRSRRRRPDPEEDYETVQSATRPKTHLAGEGLYAPTKALDHLFTGHEERPDTYEDTKPRTKKYVPSSGKAAKKSGVDIDRLREEKEKARKDRKGSVTVINGAGREEERISSKKYNTQRPVQDDAEDARSKPKTIKTAQKQRKAESETDAVQSRPRTSKVKITPKSGGRGDYTSDTTSTVQKVKSTPRSANHAEEGTKTLSHDTVIRGSSEKPAKRNTGTHSADSFDSDSYTTPKKTRPEVKLTVKTGGKSHIGRQSAGNTYSEYSHDTDERAGYAQNSGRQKAKTPPAPENRGNERPAKDKTPRAGSTQSEKKQPQRRLDDYFGGSQSASTARKPKAKKADPVSVHIVNGKKPKSERKTTNSRGYNAVRETVDRSQAKTKQNKKTVNDAGQNVEIPFPEIFGMGIGKQLIVIGILIAVFFAFKYGVPKLTRAVFKVSSITVSGSTQYSKSDIVAYSKLRKGTSLQSVSVTKTESYIEQSNPYVDASVKIGIFGAVVINVKDREPYAIVDCGDNNLIIDKDFTALEFIEKTDARCANYIIIRGIGEKNFKVAQKIGDTEKDYSMHSAKVLLEEIEKGDYPFVIIDIDVLNCNKIICNLSDNVYVVLGNCDGVKEKLEKTAQVFPVVVSKGGGRMAEIDVQVETRYRILDTSRQTAQNTDTPSSSGDDNQ